jgi:hypothetical protein
MSRYLVTETPYILGEFNTGDAVTVTVYDMAGAVIPTTNPNATEIAATGVFQWSTALLTNPIPVTGITKYLFVMDNGALSAVQYVEWGGYPDLVLGLSQSNVYIDQCVYNATYGGLSSARLRIYDEAANVGTGTGVIATFTITATITGPGQFSAWKQTRV